MDPLPKSRTEKLIKFFPKRQKLFALGCQFVTFGGSPPENLLALRKHVEVEMWEDGNVKEHDDPQEVEVGKGEVEAVWKFDAPLLRHLHVSLAPVETEQLPSHPNWVEDDESCVSAKKVKISKILQKNKQKR